MFAFEVLIRTRFCRGSEKMNLGDALLHQDFGIDGMDWSACIFVGLRSTQRIYIDRGAVDAC